MLLHNALTFKRIEPEIIEFTACESLHLTRVKLIPGSIPGIVQGGDKNSED